MVTYVMSIDNLLSALPKERCESQCPDFRLNSMCISWMPKTCSMWYTVVTGQTQSKIWFNRKCSWTKSSKWSLTPSLLKIDFVIRQT